VRIPCLTILEIIRLAERESIGHRVCVLLFCMSFIPNIKYIVSCMCVEPKMFSETCVGFHLNCTLLFDVKPNLKCDDTFN